MEAEPHQARAAMFRPRLPARLQADLLGRLAITLNAGLDLRKAWGAEVRRMPARWQSRLERGTVALESGNLLSEALAATGLFPPLVLGMVAVGDRTINSQRGLRQELARLLPGDPVRLSLIRSGAIVTVDLGPLPGRPEPDPSEEPQ